MAKLSKDRGCWKRRVAWHTLERVSSGEHWSSMCCFFCAWLAFVFRDTTTYEHTRIYLLFDNTMNEHVPLLLQKDSGTYDHRESSQTRELTLLLAYWYLQGRWYNHKEVTAETLSMLDVSLVFSMLPPSQTGIAMITLAIELLLIRHVIGTRYRKCHPVVIAVSSNGFGTTVA